MKVKKLVIIMFSLCLFTFSCREEETVNVNNKIVERVGDEDPELPTAFSSTLFFGKCDDSKKAVLYINDLRAIHNRKYKDLDYAEFVALIFNQKIKLNNIDDVHCFSLSPEVKYFYEKNGFDAFLKKFFSNVDDKSYKLRPDIEKEKRYSILYFLFINSYLNFYDDMSGNTYVMNSKHL